MNNAALALVHELPWRLRYKVPAVAGPNLDTGYLEAYLAAQAGVQRARVNADARAVVVEYDGRPAVKETVERELLRVVDGGIPIPSEGMPEAEAVDMADVVLSVLPVLTHPLLPPAARKAATYAAIAPRIAQGVGTLLGRGVKAEVLDAMAVGLAAAGEEYFTANMTQFLLKLGEYLEYTTAHHAEDLLAQLLRPTLGDAWVEREGELVEIPSGQIRPGEIVVVGPGETIAVDGEIVHGAASVNQASLTGESVPVRREPPSAVISGTVVEEGHIKVRAVEVGEGTTVARVARFLRESLRTRSRTQDLANELADKRVYITLGTAAVVYALTRSPRRLSSVFLVDYSCALKLGTAVAFKASMFQAARRGILVKGGHALEELAAVDAVVFDKTGTLTHSRLEVVGVHTLEPDPELGKRLLALVASVGEHSTHPVADAVVQAARRQHLGHVPHGEVEYIVAHGLRARVNGDEIRIGSRHYLEEHEGVDCGGACDALIQSQEAQGHVLLYVARNREPLGLIALRDQLRDEVPAVLERLRASGVENLALLTGDHRAKAEALGRELGMDEVYAEQAPEDKAGVVEALQAKGRKVAFVGDGVNDAPALSVADVGIAMPRGADIARHTSDIALLEDSLRGVAEAREAAVVAMKLIRTNFAVAATVNSSVMVGAAAGWFSPVMSALLHNGTTIGVLLNGLLRSQPPSTGKAS